MRALAELLEELVGETVHFVVLLRVVDGEEDLGDTGARLIFRLAQSGYGTVDLLVRNWCDAVKIQADDPAPSEGRRHLVDQGRARDAAGGEHAVQSAFGQVVLRLDAGDGGIDLLVRDLDVEAFGLLHLQLFIDQDADDLAGDALARLGGVLDVRRGKDQAHARSEIGHRNDVVVNDRSNAGLLRLRGASGGGGDEHECKGKKKALHVMATELRPL